MRLQQMATVMLLAGGLAACSDTMGPAQSEPVSTPQVSNAVAYPIDPLYVNACQEAGYVWNEYANECICDFGAECTFIGWGDPNEPGWENDPGRNGGNGAGGCCYNSGSVDISQPPPGIPEDWYNTLTREEKILCVSSALAEALNGISNPALMKCGQYYMISRMAIDWSEAQVDVNGNKLQGCHNGPCDAAKHAYWSGQLTRLWGSTTAQSWTNAHEMGTGYEPSQTPMDLHNNQIGRQLAAQAGDLGTLVMQRVYQSNQSNLQPSHLRWLAPSEWRR